MYLAYYLTQTLIFKQLSGRFCSVVCYPIVFPVFNLYLNFIIIMYWY